jgi:hypothetical protein
MTKLLRPVRSIRRGSISWRRSFCAMLLESGGIDREPSGYYDREKERIAKCIHEHLWSWE